MNIIRWNHFISRLATTHIKKNKMYPLCKLKFLNFFVIFEMIILPLREEVLLARFVLFGHRTHLLPRDRDYELRFPSFSVL